MGNIFFIFYVVFSIGSCQRFGPRVTIAAIISLKKQATDETIMPTF